MTVIKTIERFPILSIFCLSFLIMLPSLGGFQVTIMEARNFITAREMLTDGNWILTTMNGIPRYEKPPLPTWLTAVSGAIFGIKNVFALRLPGVLMVSLIGVYTYLFSKLFIDKRQSIINALIAITSLYILVITIEAPWDIFTHAFMLIAIYYMVRAYLSKQISHILVAVLFIALSVLSKGPISLYALFLPFLIAYPIVYGTKNKFYYKTIVTLVGGLVLGGIWFAYVRYADSETFLKIATTETSNWSSYHKRPFYYYWSFFIQSGLWTIPAFIGLLYPYLIRRVANKEFYKLSFFWTIFAIILLSIIPEKKYRYLVPVLIPLAINTGFYIQYLIQEFSGLKRKIEIIPAFLNFGFLGLAGVLFPIIGYFVLRENISTVLLLYIFTSLVIFTIGTLLLISLYKKNILHVFYLTVLLFVAIMGTFVPSMHYSQSSASYKTPISTLKFETEKQDLKVYYFDEISPEMIWQFGDKIPQIETESDEFILPKAKQFGLLVNDKDSLLESSIPDAYTIEEKKTYNLNNVGSSRNKIRYIHTYYVLTKKTAN